MTWIFDSFIIKYKFEFGILLKGGHGMHRIIVAFGNDNNRNCIAEILESGGYSPIKLCKSGKEAIRAARNVGGVIIVCSYKLVDMTADDLAYDIGDIGTVLAVGKPAMLDMCENESVCKLPTPLKKQDMFSALEMLSELQGKKVSPAVKDRSTSDKELIQQAKLVLMEKCSMTEPEAHRFIQKKSMDSGFKMSTTARLIINSYD